jgi:hypothetical protein
MVSKHPPVHLGDIQQRILLIRGEKIIVDVDLAEFYGVSTKRLNEQIRRNRERFPSDFMFRLTRDEKNAVVERCDHLRNLKYSRAMPHAFTEHGALMAASVLSTPRAVEMSVFVVRAFVAMRRTISEHRQLAARLDELERQLSVHGESIVELFKTIKQLMAPDAVPETRRIGF